MSAFGGMLEGTSVTLFVPTGMVFEIRPIHVARVLGRGSAAVTVVRLVAGLVLMAFKGGGAAVNLVTVVEVVIRQVTAVRGL